MNFQQFLTEYEKVKTFLPAVPGHIEHCENVSGDYLFHSNNLYSCFDTAHSRDGTYLFDDYMLVNSYDCDYCISSEFLYESVDSAHCYDSSYLINCGDMINCHFCVDCLDLKDCFGCVRLTHKQYCLFNRQYIKEEYQQKLAEWKKKPPEEILVQVEALFLTQPVLYKHEGHNENSEYGDQVYFDKNCYYCFDVSHSENCDYMFDTHESKNCLDHTYSFQCEFCYENNDSAFCYNSAFIDYCGQCRDCEFCYHCLNCDHCFGCAGLSHKLYCFLNRQLTKEEYFQKVKEVKESIFTQ